METGASRTRNGRQRLVSIGVAQPDTPPLQVLFFTPVGTGKVASCMHRIPGETEADSERGKTEMSPCHLGMYDSNR